MIIELWYWAEVSGQFHDSDDLHPDLKFRHIHQTCVLIILEDGRDEKQELKPETEQQSQCLGIHLYTRSA
jgi:hypothetical protein